MKKKTHAQLLKADRIARGVSRQQRDRECQEAWAKNPRPQFWWVEEQHTSTLTDLYKKFMGKVAARKAKAEERGPKP